MTAPPWPVALTPAGPVVVGAAAWRWRGLLRVTIVAKATFDLVPDGLMRPRWPVDLRRGESHNHNNPARSVSATSDLSLYLERADVVLTGHAHAPGGKKATLVTVRLAVLRGDRSPLLDKKLDVYGDRLAGPGESPPTPQQFKRIPLVYERAYGGIGWAINPFGIGIETNAASRVQLPNIVHSGPPTGRVDAAGFGPLSPSLPARRMLLAGLSRKTLEQPIAEVPDTFDWTYFQSSPPDQRIGFLQGDEWIVLEGMHPTLASLTTRLPGARGVARVLTPTGIDLPIELRADMLTIDADAEIASITWRGRFAVSAEESLGRTSVIAGVQIAGVPFEWPAMPPPLASSTLLSPSEGESEGDFDTTVRLDNEDPPPVGSASLVLDERPQGDMAAWTPDDADAGENPLAGTMPLPDAGAALPQPGGGLPFIRPVKPPGERH